MPEAQNAGVGLGGMVCAIHELPDALFLVARGHQYRRSVLDNAAERDRHRCLGVLKRPESVHVYAPYIFARD